MSSFTGRSCEPRNVSSSSPPTPSATFTLSSRLSAITFCVCVYALERGWVEEEGVGGGDKVVEGVTQQIFTPVKRRPLPVKSTRMVCWSEKSQSIREMKGRDSDWRDWDEF